MEHTVPFIFQWDETFDVGMDTGTPVALLEYRYDVAVPLHRHAQQADVQPRAAQLTAEEQRVMQAMSRRNNRASE